VQNTDPLVFGDRFVYSNCLQPAFPRLLQHLTPGSIVLFGRHGRPGGEPSFGLDTCLVVDSCQRLEPQPPKQLGGDLLDDAVLGPLFTEMDEPTTLAVYRGRARDLSLGDRPFSFVPALRVMDELPRFARPRLRPVGGLDGVINPAKNEAVKGTYNLRVHDRDAVWNEVVSQVTAQGCGLGYHVEAPPVMDERVVAVHVQGPPRALGG
jgi:hypothetical protein